MCENIISSFRCPDKSEAPDYQNCVFEQNVGSEQAGSPYTTPGVAFATISSSPSNDGKIMPSLPGLKMRRFITPFSPSPNAPQIESETDYVGLMELDPFTRDAPTKARFEQVLLNNTPAEAFPDNGPIFGSGVYLDCKFPSVKQSKQAKGGWDMVCIGNFDTKDFEQNSRDGRSLLPTFSEVHAAQQHFFVKGDNSSACDGIPQGEDLFEEAPWV